MVVTAAYDDGTTAAVTGYTASGFTSANVGNKIITVTYQGKTAIFEVNVIEQTKQTVSTPTASPAGGAVAAGTKITLSAIPADAEIWYTINGTTPAKNGSGSIKYTSTNYNTVTNTVSITVTPINLSGTIAISPSANVTIYTELTATYSGSETVSYQWKNGSTDVGTNSNKFTPIASGSYTVTVRATGYNSKTSTAVTVSIPPWTPYRTAHSEQATSTQSPMAVTSLSPLAQAAKWRIC